MEKGFKKSAILIVKESTKRKTFETKKFYYQVVLQSDIITYHMCTQTYLLGNDFHHRVNYLVDCSTVETPILKYTYV